jgi:WD40 repeat protein
MTNPAERHALHRSSSPRWRHPDGATCALLWSDDGRAVVGVSHTLVAWDAATGLARWTLRRPYTRVGALACWDGRAAVVLGGAEGEASVVDLETGAPCATLPDARRVECVAWHPRVGFAVLTHGRVRVYTPDLSAHREFHTSAEGLIYALEFSPDGRWLLASQRVSGAKRYDTRDGSFGPGLSVGSTRLERACFARGGASILACADGGAVHELDAETLAVRSVSPVNATVFALCAPGCGDVFIAQSGDGELLRASLGDAPSVLARGGSSTASGLAFSPDGTQIVWAHGPRILRLSASTAAPLDGFDGHLHPVVALAPCARDAVVSLDERGELRAWSLPALQPLAHAPDRGGAAARIFAQLPDRDALALLEPGTQGQRVFDAATGRFTRERWLGPSQRGRWEVAAVSISLGARELRVVRGDASFVAKVSAPRVAVSPDGARVAWIEKNQLTLLDTASMQITGTMKGKDLVGVVLGAHPDRVMVIHIQRVTLVDTRTMTPLAALTPPGGLCWGVATSPALDALVLNSGHALTLLSWNDFAPPCGPLPLPEFASCVSLSRDGATVITGHASGLVRTWSLPDWRRDTATQARTVEVVRPAAARTRRPSPRG